MQAKAKEETRNRLAKIEGQVRGIARMVEGDRYCIDVVRQIQAARAALGALEGIVMDDHLQTCVEHAMLSDDLDDRRAKVEELVMVLGGRRR
ncbi:MAG: metal-sensitive transcriptional regulator [Rhodospirillales bacterium]|jgi:DNA-binding FrmR family transcriptional regulator|nr:metal-sensitive transcriptional regulator [Rhodospirillales bacterium]MCY3702140.1 metal-sensitive transcriptional regulator [Rhodospirillales bacterium]MCY3856476.1 metal-sensitive transcriptional regulator [Rhodospirillales bacterium]MCY4003020.1 metal-sensitive transcriptional regulator [Rhodospirillales bacterium]MCY4098553.1 metal-sensitive transcriptional regulator [Rhodospirillales bacterium]